MHPVQSTTIPSRMTNMIGSLAIGGRIQFAMRLLALGLALVLLGSSALPAQVEVQRRFAAVVSGWGFNLIQWELNALGEKLNLFGRVPVVDISDPRASEFVLSYLRRAQQMSQVEAQLIELASGAEDDGDDRAVDMVRLQSELMDLRAEQAAVRLQVEHVIQAQIDSQLRNAGFGLAGKLVPPVFFTFTEPPQSIVVSPRDRIATIYSRMLDAEISLQQIETAEKIILEEMDASAYVTEIGGLGAFPTMVVDRAGLQWVLSTVAHEWVHNYLTLFPLGWNYFSSQEMTTINETVAEIVGNEIGAAALQAFYPDMAPAPVPTNEVNPAEAPSFDFRAQMRETRLEVDRLLAANKVTEAERYMELRRQMFVEQGYPLRVLNQAYFAFHGSYGTSSASTSPIGPMLFELRNRTPSLRDFLHTVRWFTTPSDLEYVLDTIGPVTDPDNVEIRADSG